MSSLDWLVAKKVMGLKHDGDLPPYSSDLAAAWQIDKPEWVWQFEEFPDCALEVTIWHDSQVNPLAVVYIAWGGKVKDKATAYCIARCRAALEAVGVDLEKMEVSNE